MNSKVKLGVSVVVVLVMAQVVSGCASSGGNFNLIEALGLGVGSMLKNAEPYEIGKSRELLEECANSAFEQLTGNISSEIVDPAVGIAFEFKLQGLEKHGVDRAWFENHVSTNLVQNSNRMIDKGRITDAVLASAGISNVRSLGTAGFRQSIDKVMNAYGEERPFDYILVASLSSDHSGNLANHKDGVNVSCAFYLVPIESSSRAIPSGMCSRVVGVTDNTTQIMVGELMTGSGR